jgi:hypothetical protein
MMQARSSLSPDLFVCPSPLKPYFCLLPGAAGTILKSCGIAVSCRQIIKEVIYSQGTNPKIPRKE